jgi:hypothetical protein
VRRKAMSGPIVDESNEEIARNPHAPGTRLLLILEQAPGIERIQGLLRDADEREQTRRRRSSASAHFAMNFEE